jgi:hypothetical protein
MQAQFHTSDRIVFVLFGLRLVPRLGSFAAVKTGQMSVQTQAAGAARWRSPFQMAQLYLQAHPKEGGCLVACSAGSSDEPRRSVGQSFLVSGTSLRPVSKFCFPFYRNYLQLRFLVWGALSDEKTGV